MSHLEVPGAQLYYETVGQGPVLLCISGANGSADIWRFFGECLKDKFTVVMYDRRGFSRSHLVGRQEYAQRLETDADDAAALIKHISPDGSATVIGNSSGAIVSLRLLERRPDIIRMLLSYEPPAATLLDDFEDLWKVHDEVYGLYRAYGFEPAMERFAGLTQADQSMIKTLLDPGRPYIFQNLLYWFEREFMYYPKAKYDVEGKLRAAKDKLLLVNGELSPRTAYQYRGNVALGERLGLEVVHFPGEHVGHATHAKEFSEAMMEALKARDEFYKAL